MSSQTVRISRAAHNTLKGIAERSGRSMQELLDEAIEELRRKRFFEQFNAAYARLKSDPQAWKREQQERVEWETTLEDGLSEE